MSPTVHAPVKDRRPAFGELLLTPVVGVITYDSAGRCCSVGEAAVELLGVSRETLLGQELRASSFWTDSGLLLQAEAALAGTPHSAAISVESARGGISHLDVRLEPVTMAGQPMLLAVFADTTLLVRPEDVLGGSEARFRELVDETPDFLFGLDASGTITATNKSFADAARCPLPQLVGKKLKELSLPTELVTQWERTRERVLSTGVPLEFETLARWSDGKLRVLDVTLRPIMGDGNEAIGIRGSARNITERWEAEQAAKENDNRLRTLIDKAPVAMALTRDGKALYTNPSFAKMFGFENGEEVREYPLVKHLAKESQAEVTRQVAQMASSGSPGVELEVMVIREDGSQFPGHLHLSSVELSDGPAMMAFIHDLSERRRIEESRLLTRFSVDHATDCVMWLDPEGCITDVSDSTCHHLGYSREELLDKPIFEIDSGTSPETWPAQWQDVKERGSLTLETWHRTKSGEPVPVEVTANFLAFGGREYHCAIARDITDRKRAEAILRESEERYRNLFETMLEGFAYCQMLYDEQGRPADWIYLAVNDAFANLTGLTDVVGKRVTEAIPGIKDASPELFEIYGRVASTGQPERFEIDFTPLSMWLDVAVSSPVQGYFVAVFEDITGRKHTEQALRLTQLSVDHAGDLIQWIAPDGRILYASESSCRRFGYSPEEMLTKSVFDLDLTMTPESWPEHWRLLKEQGFVRFESTHRTKEGEVFPVEVSANHVESGGQEYVFGFGRDITERKQMEEALCVSEAKARDGFYALKGIIDSTDDPIFSVGKDYRYTSFNTSHAAVMRGLFGVEIKVGGSILDCHTVDEDRARAKANIDRALRGEVVREEGFAGDEALSRRCFAISHCPVLGADGLIVGAVVSATDITERKQIEESLRRTQFAVDHSHDLIHWVDSEGRFLYVNDASYRRLGYSREELLGLTVYDVDPGAPQPWSDHFQGCKERGSFTFESSHLTKDRETFPVDVTVSYVNYEGHEYLCGTARDITERRQAEGALQESEARYRAVVESAKDAIITADSAGKIVGWNQAAEHIFGHAESDVIGQPLTLLMPARYHDSHVAGMARVRSGGDPHVIGEAALELEGLRKDHSEFPLELSLARLEGVGGGLFTAIVRDISERKRAEETLRSSERMLKSAEATAHLGYYEIDVLTGEATWSDETFRIFGLDPSAGEPTVETYQTLIHPGDAAMLYERFGESVRDQTPFDLTYRILHSSGEIRHVHSIGRVETDPAGAAVKMFGTLQDISERKQIEESLRRTQFAVDHSADYVYWISPEGRFVYANDSACNRLGYSRDEVLGMSVWDISLGTSPEGWSALWAKVRQQGALTLETQHRTRSGEIFPVEIRANYFEYEGWELDFCSVRDITDRKRAEETLRESEEQLRQSQKMEAIGQLAGGIAHDFNNLLAAILGYSDLLLANEELADSPIREDVEEIKHAADRASALTKQILAFSRRQTLRPTVVSLNKALDEMEPLLRRTLGEDIDFVSLRAPDPGNVEADVHQLEQVILNLAVNARDAMAVGGRLTLETGNAELDQKYCRVHPEATPGSYVTLSVSDTGVGMDDATRERIFEPFFTTKPPGEGTGLGLATVYGIVRQSHGTVSVESELGKGTSFRIYLPRVTAPVPEDVPVATGGASAGGSETVMVVEDEAALRGLIARVLGAAGYTTLTFGSAAEALEALEQEDPVVDLLLTDVMLPGALQGNDLARAALAVRRDLPVLYISGYTRDGLAKAGRLEERVNLLEKPFTPEALASMVRAVLDRAHALG